MTNVELDMIQTAGIGALALLVGVIRERFSVHTIPTLKGSNSTPFWLRQEVTLLL